MRIEHGRRTLLLRQSESPVVALTLLLSLLLLLLSRCCRCGDPPAEDCGDDPADAAHAPPSFCAAFEPRLPPPHHRNNRTAAGLQLRRQDEAAREAVARFRRLLDRYDCENANSVSWTCEDCQEAYKQWVCAMYLPPLLVEGEGVKPCRYICRLVEQRCPYFHPSVKDQYAGERVFKCIDPDIPDLEDIREASSYGPPHRCYCPQHLGGKDRSEPDPECQLLTPQQLRRMRPGGGAERRGAPHPLLLALLLLLLHLPPWTR